MTDHGPRNPAPEPRGGPPSVAEWLARDAGGQPPWQPPDRCLYRELLREVIDPELGINIVDLGLVYDVRVDEGVARVRMTLTTPGCPLGAYIDDEVRSCLWGAPGVDDVDVQLVWDPPWHPDQMSDEAKRQLGWRQ